MRDVFERGWGLVGHASEVAGEGQYLTTTIGREPVTVIRGSDGELRALSNVCRHRASTILEGAGTCRKVMRCPYHAWTYRLDGELVAAPSARGFNDFDRDRIALPRFRVEEVGGLVFACPGSDSPSLREVLGPVAEFVESLNLGRLRVLPRDGGAHRLSEEFGENWKILADNYLEDYHVPVAHPALVRLLDVKETEGDGNEWSEWSSVPLRTRSSKVLRERVYQRLQRRMPALPGRFENAWGNMHVWPATFFEIYPHHVDTWQLEPLDVSRTKATTMTLVDPGARPRDRAARRLMHALMRDVMAEDVEITTRVQRGVTSPSYSEGILNDEWEASVVRFQAGLRRQLPRIGELAEEGRR